MKKLDYTITIKTGEEVGRLNTAKIQITDNFTGYNEHMMVTGDLDDREITLGINHLYNSIQPMVEKFRAANIKLIK